MTQNSRIDETIHAFACMYEKRLGTVQVQKKNLGADDRCQYEIVSPLLRGKGNYPCVLSQGKITEHVMVLTHGLSDSPYYMSAIGRHFFETGINVVFPLLYGHGMNNPHQEMQSWDLCEKWQWDIDESIEIASMLGNRISLGGLSTGGALSLNGVLRHPSKITGGLFLFAAALDIGFLYENIGRLPLIQTYYRLTQEKVVGSGPNPYKYPVFSNYSGLQLARLIQENKHLLKSNRISQPVFAAHSVQDSGTLVSGVIELLDQYVDNGVAYLISKKIDNEFLAHADLVLEHPIELTDEGNHEVSAPKANPLFKNMMDAAIHFFQTEC